MTSKSCKAHPEYEFETLEKIARKEGISPVDLYMKIVRDGGASIVCQSMKEADIRAFVLFDPLSVIDRATFQQPQLISEGIKRVFVNGSEIWRDGVVTGNRPGIALRNNR